MQKTTQAMKILASWTPHEGPARDMMKGVLADTAAERVRFSSGRLTLKAAIEADFTDPANAVRVAQRVSQIKAELEKIGTLHSFAASAGAVPVGEAEELSNGE